VAGNSRSIIDAGISDFRLGVTFKNVSAPSSVIFRYVDASNLWRVGQSGAVVVFQNIVGGSLTAVADLKYIIRAGDRLEVQVRDDEIRLYLNGLEFWRVTDSALSTGTKVGINVDNTTVRLDDFTVRSA
jgi:hypothetical protein